MREHKDWTRGWTGKILRINLTERTHSAVDSETYVDRFIGGLGCGEKIYWDEGFPDRDAFHPDNPLIIMTGPLAATPVPASARWLVCGKSPAVVPETFLRANLGGFLGAELKRAGYDGIVITGKAEGPVYISINDGKVEIRNATHLWGKTNTVTQALIREEVGKDVKLMTIGPAAEERTHIATIFTDLAGSGAKGFGSVMGAKNLKGIAVRGSGRIAVAHPEKLRDILKKVKQMTGEGYMKVYAQLTTPVTKIVKKARCYGCTEGCSRTIHRTETGLEGIRKCQTPIFYIHWDKKFHHAVTDVTFRATTLANDYSLCISEVTFLLLWLEKCFEQGILSERDTGLTFSTMGSWEFLEDFVQKTCYDTGFGKILGQGMKRAAAHLGRAAQEIAEECNILPYGPKVFSPSALMYAVEPWPLISSLHELRKIMTKWAQWYLSKGKSSYVSTEVLRGIAEKFWGSAQAADFSTHEGKALAALKIQNRQYAKESLILCDFTWPIYDDASSEDHIGDPGMASQIVASVTGKNIDEAELERRAELIFTLNRAIHLREGRKGRQDDTLPESQFLERIEMIADGFGISNPELFLPARGDEVISRKGKALDRISFEQMKDEYYALRGWDTFTGLLKKEMLKEIGLPEVIGPLKDKVV
jgi:aldehyde:ferredoxin oxidoreductase